MVAVRSCSIVQADGGRWELSTRPLDGGTEWIVEDVSGWYGGSSTRAETTDRLKHGEFSTRAYRTNRAFTVHGTVIAPDSDERDWQERNLSGLAGDGDWVTVECDDGNAVLTVTARLDGEPQIVKAGMTALRFQIPFAADSPFLHAPWRETTLQPIGAGVGFEFPPFSGGQVATGDNFIVDPYGDDPDVVAAREANNTGWSWSGTDWVRSENVAGSNAFRLEPSSEDTWTDVDLSPDTRYALSYDVRLAGGTGQARYAIRLTREDGTTDYLGDRPESGGDESNYTDVMGGQWVTVTRYWDAPADAVSASFEVQINNVEGASEIRFRDPVVRATDRIITFGSAVNTDEWVWNDGNATSYPRFTVTADAPGGFAVGLGDQRVTFPWPTFPDMPVTVDMAGAVSVSGVDQSHMLGERGWAGVAPGTVETTAFEFLQGGTGFASVAHRDTYL